VIIIDCHGHYTTAPNELETYRDRQKADLESAPLHQSVKGKREKLAAAGMEYVD